jgi:hypothetical protein
MNPYPEDKDYVIEGTAMRWREVYRARDGVNLRVRHVPDPELTLLQGLESSGANAMKSRSKLSDLDCLEAIWGTDRIELDTSPSARSCGEMFDGEYNEEDPACCARPGALDWHEIYDESEHCVMSWFRYARFISFGSNFVFFYPEYPKKKDFRRISAQPLELTKRFRDERDRLKLFSTSTCASLYG